jgi:excisionase family DNA binding protein
MVTEQAPKISIGDAAERLGVHPRTIRRRIADGQLTGYRFGPHLIRLDPAEVDALLRPIPTAGRAA